MSKSNTWGRAFAERVADYLETLEEPEGVAYIHRDYCGHGLFHNHGVFRLCVVYDGHPAGPPNPKHPLEWDRREAFVAFLAEQSDASLSGASPGHPGLQGGPPNNQRLTRAMVARQIMRGHLGRLLRQEPTPEVWSDLVALFCEWSDEGTRGDALQNALERAEAWPDASRLATHPLTRLVFHHPPDPCVALARVFVFEHRPRFDHKNVARLLASISQEGARPTELHLNHIHLEPARARELLTSSAWSGLLKLSVSDAQLSDDAVAALASAAWTSSLTHLTLTHNAITDAGLIALCRSPHLRALRALDLSQNPLGSPGVQRLLDSPLMDSLTHLRLPEGDTEAVRAMARCERLVNLQELTFPFSGDVDEEAMLDLLRAPQLPQPVREALTRASQPDREDADPYGL